MDLKNLNTSRVHFCLRVALQNTILEFETGEVRNDLVTLAILDAMSEAVQKISKHLVEKPI